jgi:hypothetical protein
MWPVNIFFSWFGAQSERLLTPYIVDKKSILLASLGELDNTRWMEGSSVASERNVKLIWFISFLGTQVCQKTR